MKQGSIHRHHEHGLCDKPMSDLQTILNNRLFLTYKQSIVSFANQSVFAFELLNRPLPDSGFVNPSHFYSFAASHGKIQEVDVYAIKMSLERFLSQKIASQKNDNTSIFLNIHLSTLFSSKWDNLVPILVNYKSPIVLELSEREGLGSYTKEDVQYKIKQLTEFGFQFAVDDLGMGYSGLFTLAMVKPNFVKIDRQLVDKIDADPYRQHMMKALVQYWRTIEVQVIVEGIERKEEAEFFSEIGANLAQGYLYHRPEQVLM